MLQLGEWLDVRHEHRRQHSIHHRNAERNRYGNAYQCQGGRQRELQCHAELHHHGQRNGADYDQPKPGATGNGNNALHVQCLEYQRWHESLHRYVHQRTGRIVAAERDLESDGHAHIVSHDNG